MMHGREKSGLAIVAMKPSNEAGIPAGGGGSGAKGGGHGECGPATHAPDAGPGQRGTGGGPHTTGFVVTHPWWEPYAGKPHVRFCAGGGQ